MSLLYASSLLTSRKEQLDFQQRELNKLHFATAAGFIRERENASRLRRLLWVAFAVGVACGWQYMNCMWDRDVLSVRRNPT